ncbi:MAG: hypothetical protein ACPGYM_00920 [Flavobacteriales bacterium]
MVAGVSFLIYPLLFFELFRGYRGQFSRTTIVLLIFLVVQFVLGMEHEVQSAQFRSAVIQLFGFALLIIGPPLVEKKRQPLEISTMGLRSVLMFYFILAGFSLFRGTDWSEALFQISCISIVYYLGAAGKRGFLYSLTVLLLSGARAIAAGWFIFKGAMRLNPRRWKVLCFAAIPTLFVLFVNSSDWLISLQNSGTYLKGRTGYWLNLVTNSPISVFGSGSGYSADMTSQFLDRFQLPHNDYLRVIYDYGILGVVIFCRSLFILDTSRNLYAFLFAVFCITGNPLSFPSAITGLVMSHKYRLE